jgi:hypothetical protein
MLTSPKYALKVINLRGIELRPNEWNASLRLRVGGKIWNRSPFEFSDINIRFASYENSESIVYNTVHIDKLPPNTMRTFGSVFTDKTYAAYGLPVKVIEKEAAPILPLSNHRFRFFLTLLNISISITAILFLYYLWYKNYSPEYGLRLIDKPTILRDSASEKGHIHNILMATLKNFSRREFSDINLKFALYINNNEQIGTLEVHIDNLQPNKICKISQPLPSKYQNVEHALCQLVKITVK